MIHTRKYKPLMACECTNVVLSSSLVTPRMKSAVRVKLLTRKGNKHSLALFLTYRLDKVNVRDGTRPKEMTQPISVIAQSASGLVLPDLTTHKMCPLPEQWQFHKDVSGGWEDNHELLRIWKRRPLHVSIYHLKFRLDTLTKTIKWRQISTAGSWKEILRDCLQNANVKICRSNNVRNEQQSVTQYKY